MTSQTSTRTDTVCTTRPALGRWAAGLLAILAAGVLPGTAFGQCGGSLGMANNPSLLDLTSVPLGEIVRVTLNPAKSNLSNPLTISQVRYALACADNDDQVPCTNGNDIADQGGAPIAYVGNVGAEAGNCGAVSGTDNGDGTVTFNFPPIVLDNDGCTITFDVEVNDKGTDSTPLSLTSASETNGTCGGETGSAAGSASVTLVTVPDIELLKEISIDGGATWFDANSAGSAPYAEFPSGAMYRLTVENTGTATLTNIVINDPTLNIVNFPIADMAPGDVVVLDSGDIPELSVATRCDQGGTFENIATVDAESADDGTPVDDSDPANLVCVGIAIDKTGDLEGKVGDDVDYTITLSNLSDIVLDDCSVNDTLLGGIFGPGALPVGDTVLNESYTVQVGDDDPLPNVATLTCTVAGPVNTVNLEESDDHEVDLLGASIEVTKDGPALAKVGDTIEYEIGFTSTGELDVENCTGTDTVLGPLGDFTDGVPRIFPHVVQAGTDPLDNVATITCDVVGFSNQASDDDSHSVDIIDPSVDLTKVCFPDPVAVGDDINWDITVDNTGDADLDCLVNDPTAGFVDEQVLVAAGTSETISASRPVEAGDAPTISNTATVSCTLDGIDLPNVLDDEASDDCEVQVVNEICRTPGFWGTHAGEEKRRSSNLTQIVLNAAGGSIQVCGQTIDNTGIENVHSAVEAMCVSIEGLQQRQLARQLTAAALNCIISGGGANCSGTSIAAEWAAANAACIANAGDLSSHIGIIDAFNNNEICHERELSESDVFDGVHPLPGPAGSSNACSAATGNGWKVVPAPGGETP